MKENWTYKKFEECLVKAPKLKQVQTSEYNAGTKYPIVSQEEKLVSGYCDNDSLLYKIEKPVVVFGDHTRVLKYIDFDFVVGADGVKILIPQNFLDAKFLLYYLQWYQVPSLGYSRHYKLLKEITIPVPPLSQQQSIVAELDNINNLINIKKAQLDEYDKLAQSIFYEMFGDPIDNPKKWEVKKLGDEFDVSSGGTPSTKNPEYWDGGDISWIGSNMCQNKVITNNDGKFITQKGLEHSNAKLYSKGTVLVALVGATIGKVALLQIETTTNQNIAGINVSANKQYVPFFVFYVIQSLYCLFENVGEGKFKMANLSFVRSLPIINPPLSLQQSFAEKIEAIEHQKELVKQSLNEVKTLFDSRMDYYFN